MQTSGKKNCVTRDWNLKSTIFVPARFFINKGKISLPSNQSFGLFLSLHFLYRIRGDIKRECLGLGLTRAQEMQGKVVDEQQYNHTSSSTKNNHNFLCSHHSYSCFKSIKDYTSGLRTSTLQKVWVT